MRRFRSLVSLALVAVLLLTVLAPDFGSHFAESRASHSEPAHDEGSPASPATNDSPSHGDNVTRHGHGCAGHAWGHLVFAMEQHDCLPALASLWKILISALPEHPSDLVEKLERPPTHPSA